MRHSIVSRAASGEQAGVAAALTDVRPRPEFVHVLAALRVESSNGTDRRVRAAALTTVR